MSLRGKTITTYLIDGNPRGMKRAFISNHVCQCMAIPRTHLAMAKLRDELNSPSLYLLFGDDKKVYVGETENFLARVDDHQRKKDFWNEAVVFYAKEGSLTKADVQFLEHLALAQIKAANLFTLEENKQKANAPKLPEHQRDTVLDFFDDVQVLAAFLGYPLFDQAQVKAQALFYCRNGLGADAKAVYADKSMRVLAGSKVRKDVQASYGRANERAMQLKSVALEREDYFELTQDMEFPSPSSASDFCVGGASNGWMVWINADGQTLDDVYRKSAS